MCYYITYYYNVLDYIQAIIYPVTYIFFIFRIGYSRTKKHKNVGRFSEPLH